MSSNYTILIISCYNIVNSNTAGEHRVLMYLKSIFENKQNINTILYSNSNIYNLLNGKIQLLEKNVNLCNILLNCKRCSVLIYPSTNFLLELFYLLLIKLFNHKVFLELNEIRRYSETLKRPSSVFNYSIIKYVKSVTKIMLSYIQDFTIKYYSGIITISDNITAYYSKFNDKILQIPILTEIPKEINTPIKYEYDQPFKIGFTGTINIKKENLNILCIALNKLNPLIEIHYYGTIDKMNEIELDNLHRLNNLTNRAFYHGLLNHAELYLQYRKLHLLILPRGYTKQNHYGLSTKLSEYMISGRPLLTTDVSDNKKYVNDSVNGFIIQPDSIEELVNKISYIYENYNKISKKISINASKTAKEYFNYKLYSNQLISFLG